MKIIVFSDSHGETEAMQRIIIEEKPDGVIHLGDITDDAEELARFFPNIPVCYVSGNNDRYSDAPAELVYPAGQIKIFLCHGHRLDVRRTLTPLYFAAKQRNCSVALYGHTHIPLDEVSEDVRIINPGSVTYGNTYARIFVNGTDFSAEIVRI